MGSVRNIAIAVLILSFFTFVAFFGRLPALRNTPIGILHRVIWVHIPRGFRAADERLTSGRLSASVGRLAHTLWNDRHPVVMIFFILLLFVSEIMFLPSAWSFMSTSRKIKAIVALALPYVFLYLAASRDPGYVTPSNHVHQMSIYPYDYTIFHPGNLCRTCRLLKPARSKHCHVCKRCIAKCDHHCVFINNCVGYNNHHWFLLLLFTTGNLTTYAVYIGNSILSTFIVAVYPDWSFLGFGFTWSRYFSIWGWALQEHTQIGSITLLCFLITPLVYGLFLFHIYLIWCGTTTNESQKWSDWDIEMGEGYVFKRALSENREKNLRIEPPWTHWPAESQQIVLRTADGQDPVGAIGDGEWQRVWGLRDVENLYDIGFVDNLKDVFFGHQGVHHVADREADVPLETPRGRSSEPSSE
ncbi:putative palmitoyltransferase swf1 protein [Botrytis fragariae]|uniref:Palmitoyltransferase n=1 Tax=Botrytis fragariae TaxID=1964551 RepID=A0A8H6AQC6_9HELO|nr:putative palmitoyltransferase swf1 protein [Botrytis fragariae]KAF5871549.1 putative palmitoyltransferase swf1 protein [Botrytis fragariae]